MSGSAARGAVLVAAALLAACAVQPRVPGTTIGWSERREALLELADWQARGRIAVKTADGGGQGSLRWKQAGSEATIRLSGPFGAGAYEIRWTPGHVVVTGRGGRVETDYRGADAAQRFVDEQIGWRFPAQSTRYWLLGVPDPSRRSRERFGPDGWLASIEQDGWSIGYDVFELHDGNWLPGKIVMQRENARIRLVIDRWIL